LGFFGGRAIGYIVSNRAREYCPELLTLSMQDCGSRKGPFLVGQSDMLIDRLADAAPGYLTNNLWLAPFALRGPSCLHAHQFDVFRKAEQRQYAYEAVVEVHFPPRHAVRRRYGMCVMVVMPSLSTCQQSDPPVIG